MEQFEFASKDPHRLISRWLQRYGGSVVLTLPVMTAQERKQKETLEKRLKEVEKQLEFAQLQNIALETLIDVAEEQLKISIRKKSGAKQ